MTIEEWWPLLEPETQKWLVENNGADVIDSVASEINQVGGSATPGIPLPDEQVDWIEAAANGEGA